MSHYSNLRLRPVLRDVLESQAREWNHPTSTDDLARLQKLAIQSAFKEVALRLGPEPNIAKPIMEQILEEI